jgi:methyltransferase family protein
MLARRGSAPHRLFHYGAVSPPLTQKLRARPLHAHSRGYLGLAWAALAWLERNIEPEMSTLETGSGTSTVVFAASGAAHVAISPEADEHQRIAAYCEQEGIALDRVRFIAESSETALAGTWHPEPLDVVLIDGAHSFPFPVLDWYNTAPHLRVGGRVLVDDANQPTANLLARFLRKSPSWEFETVLGHRTACFRKLDDDYMTPEWDDYDLGRSRFDYLPPGRRLVGWLRHRVFERPPLVKGREKR